MTDLKFEANIARDLRHTPERGEGSGGWVMAVRYLVKELADVRAERDSAESSAVHIHTELDAAEAKLADSVRAPQATEALKPCLCGEQPREVDCLAAATPSGMLNPSFYCRRSAQATEEIQTLDYQARVHATNRLCGHRPCDQEFSGMPSRWCSGCLIAALLKRFAPLSDSVRASTSAESKEIINATLKFLYDHQHELGGTAEVCNLWEQLHTLLGCEECSHRWKGTTFVAASSASAETPADILNELAETWEKRALSCHAMHLNPQATLLNQVASELRAALLRSETPAQKTK